MLANLWDAAKLTAETHHSQAVTYYIHIMPNVSK